MILKVGRKPKVGRKMLKVGKVGKKLKVGRMMLMLCCFIFGVEEVLNVAQ